VTNVFGMLLLCVTVLERYRETRYRAHKTHFNVLENPTPYRRGSKILILL
jgi:hypothetical protein